MEITAPSRWKCVEFLSDIHLDANDLPSFEAWRSYLRGTDADAVFILGDLFEVWVGDDAMAQGNPFQAACVAALQQAGQRLDLYIMHGNRDFLMGPTLMQACHASALDDPCVLLFGGQRIVLSHGDALCIADAEYQAFRQTVRSADWQTAFLAKPLSERQAIARGLRMQSESRKQEQKQLIDVDNHAANSLLDTMHANLLVHGHTHQPGEHALADGKRRLVLSDWCLGATPPRADALRFCAPAADKLSINRIFPKPSPP